MAEGTYLIAASEGGPDGGFGVPLTASPGRFLRNLAIVWVAVIVVTASVYSLASRRANANLDRAEAALHAMGLPANDSDFDRPTIPAGENRATGFVAAGELLAEGVYSPKNSSQYFGDGYVPYPDAWWKLADASATANTDAIAAARAAMALPRWSYGEHPARQNNYTANLARNNRARGLAGTLADEALRQHFLGNEAAAFDLNDAAIAVGTTVRQEPSIASYMVGLAIDALAQSNVSTMAADLHLGSGLTDVPPERIRRLIDDLLIDRSTEFEKVRVADVIENMTRFRESGSRYVLILPILTATQAESLSSTYSTVSASRKGAMGYPTPFTATKRLTAKTVITNQFNLISHTFGSLGDQLSFTNRRSAIALAMALYRKEHGGRWPASLEALVPAYLPKIPVDPYHPNSGPFGYVLLDEGTRPLLLSADLSHRLPAAPFEERTASAEWGYGGRTLDLSRVPPPPTTQPSSLPSP